MKHASEFNGISADDEEEDEAVSSADDQLFRSIATKWNEPFVWGNITQPELSQQAIHDHLMKMVCCHPNRNARELAASFLYFDLNEMADELLEFGSLSPEFTAAVLELRLNDATQVIYDLQWKNLRKYEAEDIIHRAEILEQFLEVQHAAASTRDELLKKGQFTPSQDLGDLSPVGKFAMKCATLAESNELGRAVHWFEPPSWTLVSEEGGDDLPGSQGVFLQILQFFRAIVVQDHALVKLKIPPEYSPDWVAAQSDPKKGARPAKEIVPQIRARGLADRFGDDYWRESGLLQHFREAPKFP